MPFDHPFLAKAQPVKPWAPGPSASFVSSAMGPAGLSTFGRRPKRPAELVAATLSPVDNTPLTPQTVAVLLGKLQAGGAWMRPAQLAPPPTVRAPPQAGGQPGTLGQRINISGATNTYSGGSVR